MDIVFPPCVERVTEMRSSMSSALCQSLASLLAEAGSLATSQAADLPEAGVSATPADFTAYFDLLVALKSNTPPATDGVPDFVLQRALSTFQRLCDPSNSLQEIGLSRPAIITLTDDYLAPDEMESLARWWDMEPDNAMDLTAVENNALADADNKIRRALDELEQASPELYGELLVVTREIVIAKPGHAKRMSFGGVSSFAAWGAIGINERAHTHWADYLRTIVHETAHLILFAVARDEPLVLNDVSERKASPLREDARPIDGIFHAAFVSAREALALDECLSRFDKMGTSVDLQVKEHVESLLGDSVVSFSNCCRQLDEHARLSPLGAQILQEARSYMDETFELIA